MEILGDYDANALRCCPGNIQGCIDCRRPGIDDRDDRGIECEKSARYGYTKDRGACRKAYLDDNRVGDAGPHHRDGAVEVVGGLDHDGRSERGTRRRSRCSCMAHSAHDDSVATAQVLVECNFSQLQDRLLGGQS